MAKKNIAPPKNRKWAPGYYKITRVGGREATMGPSDMDYWFCRISDTPGGWGVGNLESHDYHGRPYGYIDDTDANANHPRKDAVLSGCGERYLDRLEASKYFEVTRVAITPEKLEKWSDERSAHDRTHDRLGRYARVDG